MVKFAIIVGYKPAILLGTLSISVREYKHDGVVVGASASQSVDLGSIPLVESYQKTLINCIHSFPAWRSAFKGGCGEQAGKFAYCILGKTFNRTPPPLCVRQVFQFSLRRERVGGRKGIQP